MVITPKIFANNVKGESPRKRHRKRRYALSRVLETIAASITVQRNVYSGGYGWTTFCMCVGVDLLLLLLLLLKVHRARNGETVRRTVRRRPTLRTENLASPLHGSGQRTSFLDLAPQPSIKRSRIVCDIIGETEIRVYFF